MDYNTTLQLVDRLDDDLRSMKSIGPGGEVNNMADVSRHLLENIRRIILSHEAYASPETAHNRRMQEIAATFRNP